MLSTSLGNAKQTLLNHCFDSAGVRILWPAKGEVGAQLNWPSHLALVVENQACQTDGPVRVTYVLSWGPQLQFWPLNNQISILCAGNRCACKRSDAACAWHARCKQSWMWWLKLRFHICSMWMWMWMRQQIEKHSDRWKLVLPSVRMRMWIWLEWECYKRIAPLTDRCDNESECDSICHRTNRRFDFPSQIWSKKRPIMAWVSMPHASPHMHATYCFVRNLSLKLGERTHDWFPR